MTKTKANGLGRSPLHLLHRVSQLATEMFSRNLGESDLTPRQVALMMAVVAKEGLSQSGIMESSGIDRSTVTDIVRRLQKKGWLQRRRSKVDARAYSVNLTDKGRNLLRNASPLLRKVDEQILGALPGGRGEQLMGGLVAIVTKLERNDKARTI